jgi:hypothetical protein
MTGREISGKGGTMKNLRVLALAALLPLAACGGPAKTAKAPPPFYCPQVAVLEQAQTLTLFLPGRADVAARVSTAQITGVSGSCLLQPKKNAVLVTVNTAFLADNGPANNSAALVLPWFTAITSGDSIIQKIDYSQKLAFDGNVSTVSATAKPVKIELPNTPATAGTEILVGFEESPDQLAYAAAHPNAAP